MKPTPLGLPVGSNYIAIVIDTSGSMRDPNAGGLWPIAIRKIEMATAAALDAEIDERQNVLRTYAVLALAARETVHDMQRGKAARMVRLVRHGPCTARGTQGSSSTARPASGSRLTSARSSSSRTRSLARSGCMPKSLAPRPYSVGSWMLRSSSQRRSVSALVHIAGRILGPR